MPTIFAPLIRDILTGVLIYLMAIAFMYVLPLAGAATWLILPFPMLFYRLKIGRHGSIVIMAVSLVVMMVIARNLEAIALYFGSLLLTGLILGECIEKHLSIEKIMFYTVLCVFGACLTGIWIYAVSRGQGIEQLVVDYVERYQAVSDHFFSELEKLYPELNLDRQVLEKENTVMLMVLPGIFIDSYLLMVWLNILLMKKILLRKGLVVQTIDHLNRWKAPDLLVYGLIALSVSAYFASGIVQWVCVNGLIVLLSVYFFQGIAVVSFFFQKKNAPSALRFFFYFLIAILPQFMILVVGCGLFDTWINFRKLGTTPS